MRLVRPTLVVLVCLAFAAPLPSQQTTPTNPQGSQLLQSALNALVGNTSVNDATLSGTVRRIAGSDDESGTAAFKALASGAGRTDLSLSSGPRSEVRDLSVAPPVGSWSGPDRISHPIALHNLTSEPAWFFPAFAIARRLSTSGYVITYIGRETRNGQAVEHVSVSQTPPLPNSSGGPSFEHLTQLDFFLDSTTFLPAAISYNIHPDNNALLDIPVEVQFSDYRAVAGTQVPYHIQKYLNNSLLLDFQVQSVTLNSGLTASTFNAL